MNFNLHLNPNLKTDPGADPSCSAAQWCEGETKHRFRRPHAAGAPPAPPAGRGTTPAASSASSRAVTSWRPRSRLAAPAAGSEGSGGVMVTRVADAQSPARSARAQMHCECPRPRDDAGSAQMTRRLTGGSRLEEVLRQTCDGGGENSQVTCSAQNRRRSWNGLLPRV